MKNVKSTILAATLACTFLVSQATVASASQMSDGVPVQENQNVISQPADATSLISPFVVIDIDGGTWNYGVALSGIWVWQYSYYYHGTRDHYSNAMMNEKYSGRVYADAGDTSVADSPKFNYITEGYTTNNSYYGFND